MACFPFNRLEEPSLVPHRMVASADRASFGPVFEGAHGSGGVLVRRWHGETAQAFRQGLIDEGAPPQVCRSCAIYNGTF